MVVFLGIILVAMVFYVDLQPKDGPKCGFRQMVYKTLSEHGYTVIEGAKPFSKVDTSKKTAIDIKLAPERPIINERTSWAYFIKLLDS